MTNFTTLPLHRGREPLVTTEQGGWLSRTVCRRDKPGSAADSRPGAVQTGLADNAAGHLMWFYTERLRHFIYGTWYGVIPELDPSFESRTQNFMQYKSNSRVISTSLTINTQ
jgi:hypothetical protein